MDQSTKNFFFVGSLVVLVLIGTFIYVHNQRAEKKLPYYVFNSSSNKAYQSTVPTNKVGDFLFLNQEGKQIGPKEIGNVVYVADYFFVTCPGICKEMSSQLQRVYATFEHEPKVKIVSHTSKPEEDSVEALMNYAVQYGVKDHHKWIFLTGDKKELYHTARKQYAIIDDEGDGGEDDFIHTERFALVDKHQYIRGYYDGTDSSEVTQLIEDIKTLLNEE
jgi:protein SCO1